MPKQLVVISGKGGTGKTTIAAALTSIANNSVITDCDVDAANLYIILKPNNNSKHQFGGGKLAVPDHEKCTLCETCIQYCRFNAISIRNNKIHISETACEGCGLCMRVCPENAIKLTQSFKSKWFTADTRYGPMVHAKLGIGEDNSGKLVTELRQQAVEISREKDINLIIIDGPPGIGCPVIASITGADMALIVTEPTKSGVHDLKRTLNLAENFSIKTAILINKADINPELTGEIEALCKTKNIELIGKLPFDKTFVNSMVQRLTLTEYIQKNNMQENNRKLNVALHSIWEKIKLMLPL